MRISGGEAPGLGGERRLAPGVGQNVRHRPSAFSRDVGSGSPTSYSNLAAREAQTGALSLTRIRRAIERSNGPTSNSLPVSRSSADFIHCRPAQFDTNPIRERHHQTEVVARWPSASAAPCRRGLKADALCKR